MDLTAKQQAALARWNDLGTTTPTHPVLQMAYELYLSPLGLKNQGLQYDAFAAIESPKNPLAFTRPVFDVHLLDKTWGQYSVIEPLVPLLDRLEPLFNTDGTLEEFRFLKEDAENDPAVVEFQNNHAQAIFELSETVVACAKLYIDGALEALIIGGPQSERLCEIFVQNPRRFSEVIFEIFTRTPSQPNA